MRRRLFKSGQRSGALCLCGDSKKAVSAQLNLVDAGRMRQRSVMAEYLAKVVAIHPPTARRALEKMVGFASEQVGHATTPIPPTRKLNDVPFGHVASLADTRTPPERF